MTPKKCKSYQGDTLSDFLKWKCTLEAARLKKKSDEAICQHANGGSCWLYFKRGSFMSLFVQILCCLSRETDVSGNNATAIGLSLPEENISRSQSPASNPTQDGVVPFSSYFFLNFCSVKLAKHEF